MRNFLLACTFILCTTLTSCSNRQRPFPETINVVKTEKMQRLKGTKLFVSAPTSYKPMESLIRLQRDNNTYFQAMPVPNANFNEYKSKLSKQEIERQGARVDIHKTVKYNGYDAIYFSGPSKTAGETKLGLAFGDDAFTMLLIGVCKTSDKAGMDELNTIISTSYYDKTIDFNPLELVNFKFDESITGFKYATSMGNMFIYTPNGKADLEIQQDTLPIFMVSSIDAPSFQMAKKYLESTISQYSNQGLETINIQKKELTINGNPAYEVTIDLKDPSHKTASMYQVIIHSGTKAVIFLGTDPQEKNWLDKFKATAQTIKL